MQNHTDVATDVALGILDEGVHGALERGVPLGLVDELGPGLLHAPLVAALHALQGDGLERPVRLNEGDGPGGLVDLTGLDAHEPVLHHVDTPHALGPGPAVELLDGLQRGDLPAVDGHRDALLEGEGHLVGQRRVGGVIGVDVDVLSGGIPQVLEEPGLDGTPPDVLVDGEGVVLGGLDRQVVLLGVVDGDVASQRQVSHRGDAVHVGSHRGDGDLEADLVVTLAGAAVRHRVGTELAGRLDQVTGDDGPGERRDERVGSLVEGVGLESGHAVVVGELIAGVGDVGLDGAAVEGSLTDHLEVGTPGEHGTHLTAGGLADPADGNRRVQASGVGQDDTVLMSAHGISPLLDGTSEPVVR